MVLHFVMSCTEVSMELCKGREASAAVALHWEIKDVHIVTLKSGDAMLKCKGLKPWRHDENYMRLHKSYILSNLKNKLS